MTLTSTAKVDGLIVERPTPLPPGQYEVAWLNARLGAVPAAVLTVDGDKWSLDTSATLHDVTLISQNVPLGQVHTWLGAHLPSMHP